MDVINRAIDNFRKQSNKIIRVVSHIDCDGLCSGSLFVSFLLQEDIKFVFSTVKQLDEDNIKILAKEPYEVIVFTDLGSGSLKNIKKHLYDREIFIFDHHIAEEVEHNFNHVNLVDEGLTDSLCGSGVTYLFLKEYDQKYIKLSHLAVTGAIGDFQEFTGLQEEILKDAINAGKIEKKQGLRLFGSQTRPLYKILQYSSDPYIPGISGNEENAINFLRELEIPFETENGKTRLIDLDANQLGKLTAAIVMKRVDEEDPEDVHGDIYLLKDEKEGSLIRDCREFSTLLNCCGRMGMPTIGIGVCLNDPLKREQAEELLRSYRKELLEGLNWIQENKDKFTQGENYFIVQAEDNIRETIIGTVTSIFSKSNIFKNDTILIGTAYADDKYTKISARIVGYEGIDLKNVLEEIIGDLGVVGGHTRACGGLIIKENEPEFINKAKKVLEGLNESSEKKGSEKEAKNLV